MNAFEQVEEQVMRLEVFCASAILVFTHEVGALHNSSLAQSV